MRQVLCRKSVLGLTENCLYRVVSGVCDKDYFLVVDEDGDYHELERLVSEGTVVEVELKSGGEE